MVRKAEELYREALALSDEGRERLLFLLAARRDDPSATSEPDEAVIAECKRRIAAIDSGAVKTIPADDVLREARELLDR